MNDCICTIIPNNYIFFGKHALMTYFKNFPEGNAFVLVDENINFKVENFNEKIKVIYIKQLMMEDKPLLKHPTSILNIDSKLKSNFINYVLETYNLFRVTYLDFFKWMYYPYYSHKLLPNFLYEIYKKRPDLQKKFPDPFGRDEKDLILWGKYAAAKEYKIEQEFINLPLYGSLEWALSPLHPKTVIPKLLFAIYQTREDLQKTFPEPFGKSEKGLLLWAQNYLFREYKLLIDLRKYNKLNLLPFKKSSNFLSWAVRAVNNTTYLPNILFEIYKTRPEFNENISAPLGKEQDKLLKWAQANFAAEYGIFENILSLFMAQNEGFDFYKIGESFQTKQKVKKGVNLIGYARAEIGVGEACRMTANSLTSTQIPFGIINYSQQGIKEDDLSWSKKEIAQPIYNTNIIHINADSLPAAYKFYSESFFKDRYNIGFWNWELPEFPSEWSDSFKLVDEVWAPTKFVQESIQKNTDIPVTRIPLAVNVDVSKIYQRNYFGLPENRFLFLAMYDTWSFQQRKNPLATIEAFKRTFAKNDPSVGLVLKVNNSKSFPFEQNNLKETIQDYKNIYLITNPLSRVEVNSLIYSSNCFVSLHRSEGFGIVLAESMYLGKPVIGTNWSGNTDFMTADNSCAVDYKLIKIGKDYGPYKHDQVWADPDIEHASYYMRKLVNDSAWYRQIADKGQETIRKNFSANVVGQMIKNRLLELNLIN